MLSMIVVLVMHHHNTSLEWGVLSDERGADSDPYLLEHAGNRLLRQVWHQVWTCYVKLLPGNLAGTRDKVLCLTCEEVP